MEQFVSRRRRRWTPLTQMDPVIHLSERHRSDMLLDLSGLTRKRCVEEQASNNNESDFDKVADALVIQHQRIHLRESRKRPKEKAKIRIGFEKEVNTSTMANLERVLATQTPTSWKTTTMVTTRSNERILTEHTATRLTLEVTAEKKF